MNRFSHLKTLLTIALAALAAQACSPVPRHKLTLEEKTADMEWVYSQFTENYAPLELKEKLYAIDYSMLKANYLAAAQATQTNEDFYNLFYKFVAEFHDAHTMGSLTAASLPNRIKVGYLGFSGKRQGADFLVTDLLPTIDTQQSKFPIKAGDLIEKVDGKSVPDAIRAELVPYRNVGQDEANITYLMNHYFNRSSITGPMPSSDEVTLTVDRGDTKLEVTLPWVVKDLYTYSEEQQQALAKKKAAEGKPAQLAIPQATPSVFDLAMQLMNGAGRDSLAQVLSRTMRTSPKFNYFDTFRFFDMSPAWTSGDLVRELNEAAAQAGIAPIADDKDPNALENARNVPENAIFIREAKAYPTYMTLETKTDDSGNVVAQKMIAYMYLSTFEPSEDEDTVVSEVKSTIKTLQKAGVNDLIIDLLNNGGGSLTLGMRIAQALSPDKVVMPGIQFRTSDSWLDQFETSSMTDPSDSERELNRRVYEELKEDAAAGRRISRTMNAESLVNFQLTPNTDIKSKMNIVLLTNEMCASMCDIFTGIMKDNNLATTLGAQTMGAGGNVVTHFQSPNAHFIVNQTESLMVRANGDYIENNGIKPDVPLTINEETSEKYDTARKKAVELLLSK